MELYRPLHGEGGDSEEDGAPALPAVQLTLDEWYEFLMHRREQAIEELRFCENVLVPAGRLRRYTLGKRVR